MIEFIAFFSFLGLGYFVGSAFEKKHFAQLVVREKKLEHIPVITSQWKKQIEPDDVAIFISAGTVVGSDYFKTFVSNLRNFVGGRMTSYESLLDRGRREAIVRVKEKAAQMGCHKVINLRVQTASINTAGQSGGLPCMELFAYATCLKKTKSDERIQAKV